MHVSQYRHNNYKLIQYIDWIHIIQYDSKALLECLFLPLQKRNNINSIKFYFHNYSFSSVSMHIASLTSGHKFHFASNIPEMDSIVTQTLMQHSDYCPKFIILHTISFRNAH